MRTAIFMAMGVVALGCGDDDSTGQGGAGQGGATATSTTTTSTTTPSSTSTSQGAVCTDAEPGEEITVVLRNDSSERIWLQAVASPDSVGFFDVEQKKLARCPCLSSNFCKSSGASTEWTTEVGFLDPGAEYRTTWQALLYEDASSSCSFEDDDCSSCGGGTCQLGVVPPPGPLEVKGFAFADDECLGCECDASQGELCPFTFDQGAPVLEEPIEATAILQLGTESEVVVSFTD